MHEISELRTYEKRLAANLATSVYGFSALLFGVNALLLSKQRDPDDHALMD